MVIVLFLHKYDIAPALPPPDLFNTVQPLGDQFLFLRHIRQSAGE
ncbi:MAG: hypothetical protein ACREQK_17120 [Candidatus Binatia bacterium]